MKTILVPTDFSAYANQATLVAVQLAAATEAKLIFQHNVITDMKWDTLPASKKLGFPEIIKKSQEAQNKMKELLDSGAVKKVQATESITYGIPYEEIVAKAKRAKADLIVIGSHGNEKTERFYIGSTTQKVLREATCPVLMVKKDYEPKKWKKVAVCLNLNQKMHKPFKKIRDLVITLGATVQLIFINQPTESNDTHTINHLMDDFIAKYPEIKFQKVIYNHDDVAEGIHQYTQEHPVDLIALITRNRKGKPNYLVGNTETLAFRSNIPVLSMNVVPEPLSMDSPEKVPVLGMENVLNVWLKKPV